MREGKKSRWAIGSGAICAAALYLGLAILTPGSVFGNICELVGIASAVVFVGLIDGVAEQVCAMVGFGWAEEYPSPYS
jgi:hypothetical protein